jgi:hypothetical protein
VKSGEKNCPVKKSRKREHSGDFTKEIAPLQRPRRPSRKRQNEPILNPKHIPGERGSQFSFTTNTTEPTPPVRKQAAIQVFNRSK